MKIVAGILLAILVVVSISLFAPGSDDAVIDINTAPGLMGEHAGDQSTPTGMEQSSADDEARYAAMQSEFDRLRQDRQALQQRLNRLRHQLWGLTLPADQAKSLNASMLAGFRVLKTPRLLGAFSSIKGIQDEIARVRAANRGLDQVQAIIDQTDKR